MLDFLPLLLRGTAVTVEIACLAALLALALGLVAAAAKMSASLPLRMCANVYIEVFRGTSLLVQLFWLFYVLPLPPFNLSMPPYMVAVIGLGLNFGAYGAEVVRGAFVAVPRGQVEAAVALNIPPLARLLDITLPQALLNAIPPLTNLLIELLKATALVSLITLADLAFRADQLVQSTLRSEEIFTLTLAIYFALAQAINFAMRGVERRLARGRSSGNM